ncbi:glycosyltransferase family A protein [Marinimicrobium sp. LS-A18]|uniref:glycosyltransferase family A protein n=1 Tax=Marinimicrobium sp. LS-A18 TaxID=1381596 RepID=UPI000466247B|nr:glycosyltransferase family A protein [Marinimicrobium sp. LS-A18]
MIFCIFSFNRGPFLRNCVRSIEQCRPDARILVFDDDSSDEETLTVLKEIEKAHRVVTPDKAGSTKHGGLYDNMQSAIEILRDEPLVCFLQDDTQVVRPILDREIDSLRRLFAETPTLGFVQPCFLRASAKHRRPFRSTGDQSTELLYRENRGQSAGVHYSDLLITSPARLLKSGWQFQSSEPDNDRQASRLFGPMPYLYSPFAMWLPGVPAYRGKKKTWALKLAEKRGDCGFYPFEIWSQEASEAFLARPPQQLPIAEDYLSCAGAAPRKPWKYTPLSGHRWLKKLNSIEVYLYRLFGK